MSAMQIEDRIVINRRTARRFAYREPFSVGFGIHVLRIDAYNISVGGVSGEIKGIGTLPEGQDVEVYLHNFRPVAGRVLWARGREVGITFTEDLANHPKIRALLSRIEKGEPMVP